MMMTKMALGLGEAYASCYFHTESKIMKDETTNESIDEDDDDGDDDNEDGCKTKISKSQTNQRVYEDDDEERWVMR